ncbi:hypothetical protein ACQCSV_13485 [Pseudarthrobacter sp. S3]|uniref:hypothetical protein n=1 Tax=Pseudarthrobacter sp. S3 TaxID=3418419 RepID=UPI003CE7B672
MDKWERRGRQLMKTTTIKLKKAREIYDSSACTIDATDGTGRLTDMRDGSVFVFELEGMFESVESLLGSKEQLALDKSSTAHHIAAVRWMLSVVEHPYMQEEFRLGVAKRREINERKPLEAQAAKEGSPALAEGVL